MNLDATTVRKYSPIVLRTAIAVILLWFGFTQFKNPAAWTRMIPAFVQSLGISATTAVYLNGIVEILLALLLLLGLFTRISAGLVVVHLANIILILGYGPTAARDVSIALATLAVFLNGPDDFSLDSYFAYRRSLARPLPSS